MSTNLRVLLVEDSRADAELIQLELKRGGFAPDCRRVDTEPDFVSALEEQWDVIISDFSMPGFDGLRAFSLYESTSHDSPFIFVSGALGEERAVEAMRAGARDYLLKDNLARLNVAVRRELQEARNRAARQRARKAVHREERRLSMAVEASGAGIFEYTVPTGQASYASERWAAILGYQVRELNPGPFFVDWFERQLHPDDRAKVQSAHDDLATGRSTECAYEARVKHRNGEWIEVSVFEKTDESGAGSGQLQVVGVMLDLTERRELEGQLRQAQKMDAIGRLAGGIAHDFNNLLTVILSFGAFVASELPEGARAHEDMQEVLKAANRAEALTRQLLSFSRHKPVAPTVVPLNGLLADMQRMLHRIVGADISIDTRLADDAWTVRVDIGSIEQVMVNLIVNACDAMDEGGHLTIQTRNVVLTEDHVSMHGPPSPPGDYVALSVSDDGVGMSDSMLDHIFEPFFTTKPADRGTGLGLSTCYGIVRQAGGTIRVDSELGRGSTFEVLLPRAGDERNEGTFENPPAALRGSETILIAEDDEQVRRLAVRSLMRLGYRVLAAPNGVAALKACEEWPATIDLLLADVVMPEMSGKRLAAKLTDIHPSMRILFMSGYSPEMGAQTPIVDPDAETLLKPFTPESLARTVRRVLD